MEKRVDLHIHTTASDGTYTPRQAVELARKLDLAAIAVTDHDTTAGVRPAMEAGASLGIEIVPGIEISADYGGRSVHILGLFIDPDAPSVQAAARWAVDERARRNEKMVQALAADGFDISLEGLRAAHPGAVLGRPHIAERLMELGCAGSIHDAFDRYLGRGRPYYRQRRRLSLDQAVRTVRAAGGVACAAHPMQYGFDREELEAFLRAAVTAGCGALEAYYSEHTPRQQAELIEAAARYGLALSGGSDFHGTRKPHIHMGSGIDGTLAVPYGVLEGLRAARP